jgi:hypothetical protein
MFRSLHMFQSSDFHKTKYAPITIYVLIAMYQILFSRFEYKYLYESFLFHDFFTKYITQVCIDPSRDPSSIPGHIMTYNFIYLS